MTEERKKPAKITEVQNKKKKIFYVFLLLLILILVWIIGNRTNQSKKVEDKGSQRKATVTKNISSELILATTTSLEDSGLLEALVPVFEKESGLKVKIIAVGTGEALEMGRRQAADVLLVHAPEMEEKFMAEGYGEKRETIMSSDFIIAGPASDPAAIRNKSFVEAFSEIARKKSPFISRADNSGTNFLEKKLWQVAGIKPEGFWYIESGQGMGESLKIASEKQAYILTDYPTFKKFKQRLKLDVLTTDSHYQNLYSVIVVKNLSGRVNVDGARALMEFFISEKAQKLIDDFGSEAESRKGQEKQDQEVRVKLFNPLRLGRKN